MLSIKLAFRNLVGAGLRTWLSVVVLSMCYVVIIWHRGFLDGWDRQARRDTIEQEIGGGQYWHDEYDPYDPLTLEDSHAPVPTELGADAATGIIAPILVTQATIYPDGRMQNIRLKGIMPDQKVLALPTDTLTTESTHIPVLIGTRMARHAKLKKGDLVTVRWRDANGVFDARDAEIVHVMKTDVPPLDNGIFWVPLAYLQSMTRMPDEATILVVAKEREDIPAINGWTFRDHGFLLQSFDEMMQTKTVGGSIMYVILLSLALLAIFDTQVFSIFRRQREIGTLIALGMTRGGVIRLFTIEGAMHGVLAALLGAVYGVPLLAWQATAGWSMPGVADSYGVAIAETIYPFYSVQLVFGTAFFVMLAVTIVSFLPTRRIVRMNPTDAIRGKLS